LKRLKANPNDPDIANQFKKWVYGNGKVLPGLVRRRDEEAKLYFNR
jgi:lysozyme